MAEHIKIPKPFKDRVSDAAAKHNFDSAQAFADHLVFKRLEQYAIPESKKKLKHKLDFLVEEHGYSDRDEALEHMLERGLRAYEEPATDPQALENRLRGLGYIE